MDKSDNTGHWSGHFGFIVALLTAIGWGIYRYGDLLGLNTPLAKLYAFLCLCLIILLLRYGGELILFLRNIRREDTTATRSPPAGESWLTSHGAERLSDLKQALHYQYGGGWRRKVSILLLTGRAAEVDALAPGLSTQLWLEDQGTVLVWGGDMDIPPDDAWFSDISKLSRRPADAIVWVTRAFDHMAYLNAPAENSPPSSAEMDSIARRIHTRFDQLGWRLPLYVWSVAGRETRPGRVVQSVGYLLPAQANADDITARLNTLSEALIPQGIQQICIDPHYSWLLDLSIQLSESAEKISEPLSVLLTPYRPLPLAGMMFSPAAPEAVRETKHHWGRDSRWDVLHSSLPELPPALCARRKRVGLWRVSRLVMATGMASWAIWMGISYISNRSQITESGLIAAQAAQTGPSLTARLQALAGLQKTLAQLQYRAEHGVPWYQRAGLSHNEQLLTALWPRYQASAQPLLRDAAAAHLQGQLSAFTALPPDSPLREKQAKSAYDQLKLYLMLTRPAHMNAAWFSKTLLADWPVRDGVERGVWQGIAPSLLSFYGAQLAEHPDWHGMADESLTGQSRALLIRLMGMRNSESGLYQKMLARVANLYSDMRLEDMTGDTDAGRLFSTDEVVPGMFTRQAWEQAVKPAIAGVVKSRRDELDWVLTDSQHSLISLEDISPQALEQRLTERYFADFGNAWLGFLNSLRWKRATTLSDAIDQLTLMADVRQSPLVALMNTLSVQGRTGQSGEAIAASLVKSAKNLLNKERPVIDQQAGEHGPLEETFGPLLALLDRTRSGGEAPVFSSYLTRVTQVRLRLQQVTNAADPQAMTHTLARTVFEGKSVDLTDTRDYGSLLAAGLGQEWSGFGRTVFVAPMEQAWQQVLSPAAESLNVQWQDAVVSEWNAAFGGRYPFADSSSDVSLSLLARYISADNGHISRFLHTRLNGLLHREGNHWVADSINARGLTFNPAFIRAINILSQTAEVAFADGNSGIHFELRPGTAEGVMETELVIDSQRLSYMNQMPEWKRFAWPADSEAPGATLSWISTRAGTRQYANIAGSWGWIRLLDKATVSAWPGVDSSYRLSWHAPDGRSLNYTLRTEAGEGPLALLKLRHFRLPETIFSVTPVADDVETGANEAIQGMY
ncbi:ImcF-related family protein [Enterobacteriaceae bacterium ESL0689]|nr:ImcF-related family protein [Enterobacteriaceae bacterium ESL0689]